MSKEQRSGDKIRRKTFASQGRLNARPESLDEDWFHRVLVPGGRLLVAESCRSFIESSAVRALFRHPMAAQKTANEYLAMVRTCGFEVAESAVKMSSPWWSQPDFGLRERLGWRQAGSGEVTEIMLVARKPKRWMPPH